MYKMEWPWLLKLNALRHKEWERIKIKENYLPLKLRNPCFRRPELMVKHELCFMMKNWWQILTSKLRLIKTCLFQSRVTVIRETRRKISNESNYAGKPSTRHFFPLVRNDEDLAVTHDTRRLDRPHSNDPASLLHASLRFHGTKANRAVTRFERNFRIYSLTKRLSGTHNWTREKKKKRGEER